MYVYVCMRACVFVYDVEEHYVYENAYCIRAYIHVDAHMYAGLENFDVYENSFALHQGLLAYMHTYVRTHIHTRLHNTVQACRRCKGS